VDFAELAWAASRPATVTGPRDLAPLAREAAILSMEFILGVVIFSLRKSALCRWRFCFVYCAICAFLSVVILSDA
jgi:hypothetical protein